jgi:hypothetical protein
LQHKLHLRVTFYTLVQLQVLILKFAHVQVPNILYMIRSIIAILVIIKEIGTGCLIILHIACSSAATFNFHKSLCYSIYTYIGTTSLPYTALL